MKKKNPLGAFRVWIVECAAGLPHEVVVRSSLEAGAEFMRIWPRVQMADIRRAS